MASLFRLIYASLYSSLRRDALQSGGTATDTSVCFARWLHGEQTVAGRGCCLWVSFGLSADISLLISLMLGRLVLMMFWEVFLTTRGRAFLSWTVLEPGQFVMFPIRMPISLLRKFTFVSLWSRAFFCALLPWWDKVYIHSDNKYYGERWHWAFKEVNRRETLLLHIRILKTLWNIWSHNYLWIALCNQCEGISLSICHLYYNAPIIVQTADTSEGRFIFWHPLEFTWLPSCILFSQNEPGKQVYAHPCCFDRTRRRLFLQKNIANNLRSRCRRCQTAGTACCQINNNYTMKGLFH